jgi:cobalt-zinc-cadmium efflux system membrane fusion protein
MRELLGQWYRYGRVVLLCVAVLCAAGSATWVASKLPGSTPVAPVTPTSVTTDDSDKLRRRGSDVLVIPDEIAKKLGLTTAVAAKSTRSRKLAPFQGRLALDNNSLARVRSPFTGEVVELGKTPEGRPLRFSDTVIKGEVIAVVWSKDLGEKKSELVDAISKLRTDERTLTKLEALLKESGTAERSVREAERNVQADRIAVERAERTLRAWRLSDADVAAVRAEADRLSSAKGDRTDPAAWARVEIRSPRDGMILEKNVGSGDLVDTSTDLFKIGDMSRLTVWAHVFEEDLPLLQDAQTADRKVRWTVSVPARPGTTFPGTLDSVAPVIDPNQQTALASGTVENPRCQLKVGQFVTVTVDLPPPENEVEVPAEAVIEDGRESVVFVRIGPGEYSRRLVSVARRFRDAIYVKQVPGSVAPGETVVTSGAILLRDAFDQLPAGGN